MEWFDMKKVIQRALKPFGFEVRKISDSHVTPITSQWMGNFYYFLKLYERVKHLPGDIVECGVGRGRTFLYFAFFISQDPTDRLLWGFDSFQGFPEPSKEDASYRNVKKGERNNTTIEGVTLLLRDAKISRDVIQKRIRLIPDFFERSLGKFTGSHIALLHIDVDLYRAYRECLEALYPKVVSGGVVLFDEYDDPAFPGGRKAIDEYFKDKKVTVVKDSLSGKHYLVKP